MTIQIYASSSTWTVFLRKAASRGFAPSPLLYRVRGHAGAAIKLRQTSIESLYPLTASFAPKGERHFIYAIKEGEMKIIKKLLEAALLAAGLVIGTTAVAMAQESATPTPAVVVPAAPQETNVIAWSINPPSQTIERWGDCVEVTWQVTSGTTPATFYTEGGYEKGHYLWQGWGPDTKPYCPERGDDLNKDGQVMVMGYSEMPALGQGKEILVKEGWPTPTPTPTPEVPSLIEFSVAPQSVAKGDTVTVKLQTTGVWGYGYLHEKDPEGKGVFLLHNGPLDANFNGTRTLGMTGVYTYSLYLTKQRGNFGPGDVRQDLVVVVTEIPAGTISRWEADATPVAVCKSSNMVYLPEVLNQFGGGGSGWGGYPWAAEATTPMASGPMCVAPPQQTCEGEWVRLGKAFLADGTETFRTWECRQASGMAAAVQTLDPTKPVVIEKVQPGMAVPVIYWLAQLATEGFAGIMGWEAYQASQSEKLAWPFEAEHPGVVAANQAVGDAWLGAWNLYPTAPRYGVSVQVATSGNPFAGDVREWFVGPGAVGRVYAVPAQLWSVDRAGDVDGLVMQAGFASAIEAIALVDATKVAANPPDFPAVTIKNPATVAMTHGFNNYTNSTVLWVGQVDETARKYFLYEQEVPSAVAVVSLFPSDGVATRKFYWVGEAEPSVMPVHNQPGTVWENIDTAVLTGNGHMDDTNSGIGRPAMRREAAAAIMENGLTQNRQCWKRPPEPGRWSAGRAIVYKTAKGSFTFLQDLNNNVRTFLHGDIPQDQADNFEEDWRMVTSVNWVPCDPTDENLILEVLKDVLRYLGYPI